jgi:hypothetical protein
MIDMSETDPPQIKTLAESGPTRLIHLTYIDHDIYMISGKDIISFSSLPSAWLYYNKITNQAVKVIYKRTPLKVKKPRNNITKGMMNRYLNNVNIPNVDNKTKPLTPIEHRLGDESDDT